MTAPRILTLALAIALPAALGSARAGDSPPAPLSIAEETPTFRAPAKPPKGPAETPAAPEPEGPLALQDALALALMGSPELAAFSWEARASEARTLQAGTIPNPELDVRVWNLAAQDDEQEVARRRVILSQVIELGGKRRRRVDLAKIESDIAGWDYEAKRVEVATQVASHFVAALGAQRRVESSRGLVEFFEAMRVKVTSLVERGSLRGVEQHQVKRQLGLARIELQRAEAELGAARFGLAATWGSRSPSFTEAVGDLEQGKSVPPIETVIELAERSPTMSRWEAELARSHAELALAKAGRAPDLRFGAGVRRDETEDDEDYMVDVEIALPIFDRKKGEIRAARHGVAGAEAGRRAAAAASSVAIAEVYYELQANQARRSTLAEEVLPAARATFESFRVAFETVADNLGGYFDARRDLARAEIEYAEALVEYHQALAALEGLVGRTLSESE